MEIQIKYPKAKCKWCGRTFEKHHNRQTYCSPECRKEADKENNRNRQHRHYYRHRQRILAKRKGTATIGPKPNPDTTREHEIIQNEIRRIGLTLF